MLINVITLDGLKSRFDSLELYIFSWGSDWYHYRWIWTDRMLVHALPTSGIRSGDPWALGDPGVTKLF